MNRSSESHGGALRRAAPGNRGERRPCYKESHVRILVTGGAGFIGSNYVRLRRARNPGDVLVVLDALTYAGNLASLAGVEAIRFVRGDIGDARMVDSLLRDHNIEAVVHFAAESHVDRSILEPTSFVRTNVLGTHTLLEQARRAGVKRFLLVSTDEVYGDLGPDGAPAGESSLLAPRSPYAASKAAADLLAQAWFETWRFPVVITRCVNNYGPRQFPEKLVPLVILNALEGLPLPIYGDGLQVRDWIHVEDHCAALDLVLEGGREGQVYNVAGRSPRSNLDLVKSILGLLRRPESLIRLVADRPGHDRRYAVDDTRIERELGFHARWRLDAGLEATVDWYLANRPWWEAVRSGEYRDWYEKNYARRGGD